MPESLINILVYAGIVLVALVVIGVILTRLYRRATKDVALIRTGFGGEKVVLNGGIMVIPVLHELMQVRLTTVKLEVSRLNKDALITLDKLRVDVVGLFHIKVKPDAQSIAAAAQTLGEAVNSPEAVKALLDGKLVSALRSVAATMTMEHLHANRADFIQKVQEALTTDLDMNGFQLESVSITHFDQTAFEHFNENNAFDAEGLTVLTRTIEERKKIRNDIVTTNRVEIEQRNLDANNQSLEIAQAAEQARLTQEQTLAARRAEQATAIATAEAEQTRLAEIARITATQAQAVAQTEADKIVQTATIVRDGAIQTATIERDRNIELARITTAVQTAQKSEEESTATAAANEARAHAIRAEESVATAKATEIANRNRNVAVIAATQKAEEQAVSITVAATAEKEAAEARASALRTEAVADADAEKARAEGRAAAFRVDAAGKTALNEATNVLSSEQTALLMRQAILNALPEIIAAASKPMEQIDRISIVDARGLHGDGGAGDASGGNGNLADAAVAAAMRYRVGGPLIDGLMGELGMGGKSLDEMLAGTAEKRAPSRLNGSEPHAPADTAVAPDVRLSGPSRT
ncbi:flotillin family protein [Glacieibacterium frigidum]|uniref:Flotillin family protein n=1 Tax=Glacieibacterium frigidum TaxID=2593303 RepID=A0A552U6Y4_9SPHN|nr:flotillin domain-containing protein [Glacieibacterium frigidum]TRW13978.1 flotillin family protein [Glacieibacterium frigidum]